MLAQINNSRDCSGKCLIVELDQSIYISNNYIWVTPCVEITVVLSHINNDIVVDTMIGWLVVETNKNG